jgi:hypothetical protein
MLLGAFAGAGIAAGAVSLALGQSLNFHVFRQAAQDLLAGRDLYERHAEDYFKYSPTFAFLFVPFAWMPEWLAAPLWSLLNFMAAFFGIDNVLDDEREKRVALLVALAGIALATDGDQSNLLVGGALLLAFAAYERRREAPAAALVTGGALVKLFPALGAALALLSPRRGRATALLGVAALGWLALPVFAVGPSALLAEYASWRRLLAWDHANHGWCVASLLQDGLHVHVSITAVQVAGAAALAIPIGAGLWFGSDAAWRRTLVCALLVFAVLFNHRAEYTSYVLSAIALGVWYASSERTPIVGALVALALIAPGPFLTRADPSVSGVLAVLGAHRQFHALRVVPLLAAWLVMLRDLMRPFIEVRVSVRLRPAQR